MVYISNCYGKKCQKYCITVRSEFIGGAGLLVFVFCDLLSSQHPVLLKSVFFFLEDIKKNSFFILGTSRPRNRGISYRCSRGRLLRLLNWSNLR